MGRKFVLIGLLILSLGLFPLAPLAQAANVVVDIYGQLGNDFGLCVTPNPVGTGAPGFAYVPNPATVVSGVDTLQFAYVCVPADGTPHTGSSSDQSANFAGGPCAGLACPPSPGPVTATSFHTGTLIPGGTMSPALGPLGTGAPFSQPALCVFHASTMTMTVMGVGGATTTTTVATTTTTVATTTTTVATTTTTVATTTTTVATTTTTVATTTTTVATTTTTVATTTTTVATTTTTVATTTTTVATTTTTVATTTTTVATTTTTVATTTTTVATTTTTVATTTTTVATTTTTVATTTTTVATTTTTVATTTTTVATTTTTVATTTTTVATTTTTVATTTTTVATTTTTISTTTTTVRSALGDVGIRDITGPKKADDNKPKNYGVKVKNYSDTTQTRNVSLLVNGAPAGPGQLVTLSPGQEKNVKFEVEFDTAGTATLEASLFPGDSNPDNDTRTETVTVKDKGKDKDKGKGKDK